MTDAEQRLSDALFEYDGAVEHDNGFMYHADDVINAAREVMNERKRFYIERMSQSATKPDAVDPSGAIRGNEVRRA